MFTFEYLKKKRLNIWTFEKLHQYFPTHDPDQVFFHHSATQSKGKLFSFSVSETFFQQFSFADQDQGRRQDWLNSDFLRGNHGGLVGLLPNVRKVCRAATYISCNCSLVTGLSESPDVLGLDQGQVGVWSSMQRQFCRLSYLVCNLYIWTIS